MIPVDCRLLKGTAEHRSVPLQFGKGSHVPGIDSMHFYSPGLPCVHVSCYVSGESMYICHLGLSHTFLVDT